MIRTIEELSLNARPALQTMLYDGWVLRYASGYTRRANSVNPLYPSTEDLQHKIDTCESLYRARGLRTVFKLTCESRPPELDEALAARGYRYEALTAVQTRSLQGWDDVFIEGVTLEKAPSRRWLEAFCRMSAVDGPHHETLARMLAGMVPEARYATILEGERVVACGLAVNESGYVGLFDIVTDAEYRRRGYGRQLVSALLTWGRRSGAHTAYLQVMPDNIPALRLYAGLGFAETYRYGYRVAP